MPNDNPFAGDFTYPTYDPEQAQALIEEYEAETGTEVAFTLSFGQATAAAEVAQLAQQYWRDIGVEVELDGPILASDFPGKMATHEYEVAVYGVPGFVDPDVWLYIEFKSDGFLNIAAFNSPEIDEALNTAHGSSDFAERQAAYADMQAALAEEHAVVLRPRLRLVVASKPEIAGVDEFPLPDGSMGFDQGGSVLPAVRPRGPASGVT